MDDPTEYPEATLLDTIAHALTAEGYIILSQALPTALVTSLYHHAISCPITHFQPAGVGRDRHHQHNPGVRSDLIHWMDSNAAAVVRYLGWIELLRTGLNQRLWLGLFDYEAHYACYPMGAFYTKHLDAFTGKSCRVVTTVLYLNPGWHPDDGGELVIYTEDGAIELKRITPDYGKLVLFLSDRFPHAVLPATQPRWSIAGWYRRNGSQGSSASPAR